MRPVGHGGLLAVVMCLTTFQLWLTPFFSSIASQPPHRRAWNADSTRQYFSENDAGRSARAAASVLNDRHSSGKQLGELTSATQNMQRGSSDGTTAAAAMAKFTQARNPFTNPYIDEPKCRYFHGRPNSDGRIHLGPFASSQLMDPFICSTAHSVNAVSAIQWRCSILY
jgi:hypothetical protein